ncbi:MAG: hypothetical protein LBJ63_04700, partial [Prevotellaceae bacterium]|nr:hypothetical protein [Prevotellaceae bacterium]
ISIVGFWGYRVTFTNLERVATNGDIVTVQNVNNKNSESVGYIATYIIPFLFQGFGISHLLRWRSLQVGTGDKRVSQITAKNH